MSIGLLWPVLTGDVKIHKQLLKPLFALNCIEREFSDLKNVNDFRDSRFYVVKIV